MLTSAYLFANSLRIHYLHCNQDAAGQPIVCLHGLASNARIWELVAEKLAGSGYPLYAPDARGHGLTDKPDEGYQFETITGDLAAFLDACQIERPLLVGHSWGAQVVLSYAARFSVGPRAPRGIVLVDGGASQLDDQGATWEEIRQRLAPPRLAGMPLAEFMARLRKWTASWQPSEQALAIFLANMEVTPEDTIYPRLTFERHMQIVRAMWEFKTYDTYPRLRCPVLMIPAQPGGVASPQEQAYLAAKQRGVEHAQASIAGVEVHWMADTIHDIPLQRPEKLAGLIADFSARVEAPLGLKSGAGTK
jgi:pimeloyl-ACP methyl ester carboxylesterase